MENDTVLIEGCKRNESESFKKLFEKYAPKMKGVAFRYIADSDLAEDIIQDAFVKVFIKIKEFDTSGSFEGWLHRVVVNASIDQFHKLKKKNENISDLKYLTAYDINSEEEETYEYSMDELVDSINRLPEGYKLVFNMYVMDNYSHKEIAAALNITEGTSKSQLSKAREYLKKILEKQKTLTNAR